MVAGVVYPVLRMLHDSLETYTLKSDQVNKRVFTKWSLISFTFILIWIWWWWPSSGSGDISPVLFQNGMLYLNYGEDSAGVEICDTPTRLFIAIESPASDVEARATARNTWLKWAARGAGANEKGETLAEYLFFTTDTVATRAEAFEFKDVVIVSERGMPDEEWLLVEDYQTKKASAESRATLTKAQSSRGLSAGDTTTTRSPNARALNPKTGRAERSTIISAKEEKGKRHPKLCKEDMLKLCNDVEVGAGRMDECMFEHRGSLSQVCRDDLSSFEEAAGLKRDWHDMSGPSRRLSWFWSGDSADSSTGVSSSSLPYARKVVDESGKRAEIPSRRSKSKPPKLEYAQLPWCDDVDSLGGCLMKTYSTPSLTSSLPTFRFHSPAQISKPSISPGSAGGGQHHDNRHYSPKLISIFRFWMLEFLSEKRQFSFLLMLDLSNGGFLCLPSLVVELNTRPYERFLWRSKTSCSASITASAARDDSFLLMSRDVVELVRGGARREGATMMLLDRLLFRLPLSVLSDEKRLKRGGDVEWANYNYRSIVKGKSSERHVCEDLIWISDVASKVDAEKHNAEQTKPVMETGKKGKGKKDKANVKDEDARYVFGHKNATAEMLFSAHSKFGVSKSSDWNRNPKSYPVLNSGCDDEPIILKSPSMPQGVKTESTKNDREMVTAVRLGLNFDKAEKFLADTRIVATLTAPLAKVELKKSVPKNIPQYYAVKSVFGFSSTLDDNGDKEEEVKEIETKEKEERKEVKSEGDVDKSEKDVVVEKELDDGVSKEMKKAAAQVFMPKVPIVDTRPHSDAALKDYGNSLRHSRRLHSLRGADGTDLLLSKSTLGVRPRLSAWGGNEYNSKRPVIDACSFDIDCVWKKIIHEELSEWWQEADTARQQCCCASRASQAPPQCSAFKTRKFIRPDDFIAALPISTESGFLKTAANEWGPLSVLDSLPSVQFNSQSENWTISDEFAWISDFSHGRNEALRSKYELDEVSPEPELESEVSEETQMSEPEELFLDRGITVLASFPGSGNTWVRLLLEYSTGYFTGSIYNDLALSPLLPGEGDRSTKVIAVKAHTAPASYMRDLVDVRNMSRPVSGVRRVLLLVRHPLEAIWSEFQRRHAGTHVGTATELRARTFENFSGCMACRWIHYLLKHFELASDMSTSSSEKALTGLGEGVKVHVVRYERLKDKTTFLTELASALSFLGAEVPSPERLGCASFLARHSAVHRPKPRAFQLKDVYNAVPGLSCRLWHIMSKNHPAAGLLLRLFGYESYAPRGTCTQDFSSLTVCADILSNSKYPLQTCAGRQTEQFSPTYDGRGGSNAGTSSKGPIVAKGPPEEDDRMLVEPMNRPFIEAEGSLDQVSEMAWSKAIEPLHWPKSDVSTENVRNEEATTEKEEAELEEEEEEEVKDEIVEEAAGVEVVEKVESSAEKAIAVVEKIDHKASSKQPSRKGNKMGSQCVSPEGPLVSVLVSTTSRGVVKKGKTKDLSKKELEARMAWVAETTLAMDLHTLVLFSTMLPSLTKTMECGFKYHVVIGFDVGDIYFDSEFVQSVMKEWIDTNVVSVAAKRGIECSYTLLPVKNPQMKPGPVFNAMADAVKSNKQVEYVYRVNDDTEFVTLWADKFVRALDAMGGPAYGVVGPSCPQGNRAILTHDFTHRAHLDIFDSYYPEVLTDWFMDDWISRVYGLKRTRLMKDVEVIHHSKTYGRRYDVDGTHRHLVDDLVHAGRDKIAQYMRENGGNKDAIQRFLSDKFDHRQQQKEVDQSTIKSKSAAIRPK